MPHPDDDPIDHGGAALLLHERDDRGRRLGLRRVVAGDWTRKQRNVDLAAFQVVHHLVGRRIEARIGDQGVGFDMAEQAVFGQQGRRRGACDDADLRCFQTRIAQIIEPLERTILVICDGVARSVVWAGRLNEVIALGDPRTTSQRWAFSVLRMKPVALG